MIDLEKLRRVLADKIERHIAPSFRGVMRLNLIAIHPDNPNAHVLAGQPTIEETREALCDLEESQS